MKIKCSRCGRLFWLLDLTEVSINGITRLYCEECLDKKYLDAQKAYQEFGLCLDDDIYD